MIDDAYEDLQQQVNNAGGTMFAHVAGSPQKIIKPTANRRIQILSGDLV